VQSRTLELSQWSSPRVRRSLQAFASILVLGVLCLVNLPLFAQSNYGRILGNIHDVTEANVVGATVVITDVQRGISRTLTTDASGNYAAPNLEPGTYTVHVTAKGFKTVDHTNITIEVAKDVLVDIALPTGSVSETIEVTEAPPLIDTTSATLGGTISNAEINEIPLNGRNYQNLITVRPGVVRYPGGGFATLSTDGVRPEDNVFIMDGLNGDEPFSQQSMINGPPLFGDTTTTLPIDAIQEFNTLQNPKAEYGWKPGAVVNVGLKSGTNGLHGTAYAFGRDSALDAKNYFIGQELPMNLQQFGATVGGPIKKDKLFYFGGFEIQRYDTTSPYILNSPVTVSLPGSGGSGCVFLTTGNCKISIPDATADILAGGFSINSLSQTLAALYPTNNGTLIPGNPKQFSPKLISTIHQNSALGKVDYHVNERSLLTGEYFFGQLDGTVNDAPTELARPWELLVHTRAEVFGANWIWNPSSRWVNEARFGYSHFYQPSQTVDHNVPASQYGINTGITNPLLGGLPDIRIQGFAPLGQSYLKIQGPDQVIQFSDSASYTRGKHAIKFGGEFRHDTVTGAAYREAKGRIDFRSTTQVPAFAGATALENFLAGVPDSGQTLLGDPLRHIHFEQFAAFVQDDFRVAKDLTLNLGVRYELNTVIKEQHDLLSNFLPSTGIVQVGHGLSSPYNGDHNNFAPRAGFAWNVSGSNKTVVRGGVGVAYETLGANMFLLFANRMGLNTDPSGAIINASGGTSGGNVQVAPITYPGTSLNWTTAGPVFQNTNTTLNCYLNPCAVLGVDRNVRTPYVTSWNIGIQRSLADNVSLEIGYVGNHGSKLMGVRDINQVDPTTQLGPYSAQFPYLSYINMLSNQDRSNFHSLQATLTQRNYHGLSITAGYTYGHALDDTSSNWGAAPPQDSTNLNSEYASSDFDVRHRLTLTTTYALPGKKGFGQMLEGWHLNSIVSLQSGQPWTVQDTSNGISDNGMPAGEVNNPDWVYSGGERWNFVGNPADFKPTSTGLPYYTGVAATDFPTSCANNAELAQLQAYGCYAAGPGNRSALVPPNPYTFGSMGRNLFRDTGFRNWDLSVSKVWNFRERFRAQFRFEMFNVLNHVNLANPYGGQNGFGAGAFNDPSSGGGSFGCGCATPDVAASNPVLGSGGNRKLQLGLKLSF